MQKILMCLSLSVFLNVSAYINTDISERDKERFRKFRFPGALNAQQYAVQVRQNCNETYDVIKKLLKKEELTQQEIEEIEYHKKLFAAMKCTDKELIEPDHMHVSQSLPSKQALERHDKKTKDGWYLYDQYASERRSFCGSVLFTALLIVGKKGVAELTQKVEAGTKKLADPENNLTDEEKQTIINNQNLLNVYNDVLKRALGTWDSSAPLTEKEKQKIEQYLGYYDMAKCTDRELFTVYRYEDDPVPVKSSSNDVVPAKNTSSEN